MGTKTTENIKQQIDAVKNADANGTKRVPAPSTPTTARTIASTKGIGNGFTKDVDKKEVLLSASKWSGSAAPYTYDLGQEYKDAVAVFDFNGSAGNPDLYKAAIKAKLTGSKGSVIYAWGIKPSVDIPIVLSIIKQS